MQVESSSATMRVCILNDNFYRGSGVTLVVQRLARAFKNQNIELFLAGCAHLSGQKAFTEDMAIVPAEKYRQFSLMSGGFMPVFELYRFAQWLKATQCDLVHVHHRRLGVLANLIKHWTKVPVLFTGHLTFAKAAWFREFAPKNMTGVSPSVVKYLLESTRATEVTLVYNPFDFGDINAAPKFDPNFRKVISVGRLESVKGHATLIEAWALLKRQGVEAELHIFGEGTLRQFLEALIVERGLERNVKLCGFAGDLEERFNHYSFNVLASAKEGFPNAVVEAASRGIPTLLTDVDGSRDTLPTGLALPNGVEYSNVTELSEALARWFRTPELIVNDGRRFYDHLKRLCSSATIAEQYKNVYAKLLR